MKHQFKRITTSISLQLILFTVVFGSLIYNVQAQDNLANDYKKLEETRTKFMNAIKEKRYDIIPSIATADAQSIGPATRAWQEMREIGKSRGMFPYDSIIMFPKETVIVSDSVAYDYGYSKVYYTNKEGKQVELRDTFLAILKKSGDGVWKLHREVASGLVME